MQYHEGVHHLAQRVCHYIRRHDLLRAGDRLGIAVSGGADSVALFRLLLELREELGLILSVVHINHQIRGLEAHADQQFVADLAAQHGLLLQAFSADTPAHAAAHQLSLEAAAREVRYEYFRSLLADGLLDKIATAHTLDDQAETVLLRLARGTGITGLAGIYPKWAVARGKESDERGTGALIGPTFGATGASVRRGERSSPPSLNKPAIVRPLLASRRSELQTYLRDVGQTWREDTSNLDPRFTRNRVRHKLLPALEDELNPRLRELLAETAEIARAEEDYWSGQVARALPQAWAVNAEGGRGALRIDAIRREPLALQRRIARAAAESLGLRLDFRHVEELLALAQAPPEGEKQIVLSAGWRLRRASDLLYFEPPKHGNTAHPAHDFSYSLSLPGEVVIAETGTVFRAVVGPLSPAHAAQAYDPACLPPSLQVRNWRPGDRFWPAHTRAPRKIKELLQERKIPLGKRRTWPVITSVASGQERVIWVRGFPPPQELLVLPGRTQGLRIEEFALQDVSHGAE